MFILWLLIVHTKRVIENELLVLNTNENGNLKNDAYLLSVIRRKRNDMKNKIVANQNMLPLDTTKTIVFKQHNMPEMKLQRLKHLTKPLKILYIVGDKCFFNTTVQYLFSQPILFSLLVENYLYNDFSVLFLNFYLKAVAIENELVQYQDSTCKYQSYNTWALKKKIGCIIDGFFTLCAELYNKITKSKNQTYFTASNSIHTINCVLDLLLCDFYRIKSIDNIINKEYKGSHTTPLMPYLNVVRENSSINGVYGICLNFKNEIYSKTYIQDILNDKVSNKLKTRCRKENVEEVLSTKPHWLQIEILKLRYLSNKNHQVILAHAPKYLYINNEKYELTAFCCTNYVPTRERNYTYICHAWSFCKYPDSYYECNDDLTKEVDDKNTLEIAEFSSDLLLYTKITDL